MSKQIISALYGANGYYHDVTLLIISQINSGLNKILVNSQTMEMDPMPGWKKQLIVRYQDRSYIHVPDNQYLIITSSETVSKGNQPTTSQRQKTLLAGSNRSQAELVVGNNRLFVSQQIPKARTTYLTSSRKKQLNQPNSMLLQAIGRNKHRQNGTAVITPTQSQLPPDNTETHFPTTGFIIMRCVKEPLHDAYWKECYRCIRLFHQEEIVIIDDCSDPLYLKDNLTLVNTKIISSQFPGSGEFLPYYYLYQLKLFDRVAILHDSMFLQSPIRFDNIQSIRFLWHFSDHSCDFVERESYLISLLSNSHDIKNFYDKKEWHGCFGCASLVTYQYVKELEERYQLFRLLPFVKSRYDRMAMERIIGLLAFYTGKVSLTDCSLLGEIRQHPNPFSLNYHDYQTRKPLDQKIIKIWSHR